MIEYLYGTKKSSSELIQEMLNSLRPDLRQSVRNRVRHGSTWRNACRTIVIADAEADTSITKVSDLKITNRPNNPTSLSK